VKIYAFCSDPLGAAINVIESQKWEEKKKPDCWMGGDTKIVGEKPRESFSVSELLTGD